MPKYRVPLVNEGGHWPLELLTNARVRVLDLQMSGGRTLAHNEWKAQAAEGRVVWVAPGKLMPRGVEAVIEIKRWTIFDVGQMVTLVTAVGGVLALAVPYLIGEGDPLEAVGDGEGDENCCYERDAYKLKLETCRAAQ